MKIHRTLPVLASLLFLAGQVAAQETGVLTGTVLSAEADAAVPGAILRIAGTTASAVSGEDGRFVLRGLPVGQHRLEVSHPDFGTHSLGVTVRRPGERFALAVRISSAGIAIDVVDAAVAAGASEGDPTATVPVTVTENATVAPPSAPAGRAGSVADQARIQELAGGSRNVGELIRRAFPTMQVRETDATGGVAGNALCLEFRGVGNRSITLGSATCNNPQVYLDGIAMGDPSMAYGMTALAGLQWIQAIPPAEASAQFAGATNGVILIATTNGGSTMGMAPGSSYLVRSRRTSFDWEMDPNGHPFFRAFLGAAAGSAVGLLAGREVGRQCIYIEDRTREIETSCRNAGVAGVSLVALALPAMGSAIGAHFGGSTDVSVGKWVPSLIGAGMALFPGYVYSLTTVGDGVGATNNAGKVFLLVGTPLFTTLADRLYRTIRTR